MKKNKGFNERLTQLPVPEPDATARFRALSRALVALEHRETTAPMRERHKPLWLWPIGCALAMLLLLFLLPAHWFRSPKQMRSDLVLLDEMSALFDKRLEALVERDGEMDVQLSPQEMPMPVSQQPICIVLSRGHDVIRVLSFSGREVCLSINGQKTCLDVLATKDGEVIITGGSFIWNRQHPASLAGYYIKATMLAPAS